MRFPPYRWGLHMSRQLHVTSRHVFGDALELLITVGEECGDEPLVLDISFARSRSRSGPEFLELQLVLTVREEAF
jgi:hypothetical protein